jgi:hypothetical protein
MRRTMKVVLNIGLGSKADGGTTSPQTENMRRDQAVGLCMSMLVGPLLVEMRHDAPEPTLVVQGRFEGPYRDLHRLVGILAAELDQEAIAYTATRLGRHVQAALAGPNAASWEPFDYSRFYTIKGR